jgi:hypothetical protein
MSWVELIPGCFGNQDLNFGGHATDKERCRTLLKLAIESKANFHQLNEAFKKYLESSGVTEQHLKEQLERIRDLSHWLD